MPVRTSASIDKAALDKAPFRAKALARRAELDPVAREAAAERAAFHAFSWLGAVSTETIALFSPIGTEIDTAPLARMLREAGARLALPVVVAAGRPLSFREWRDDVPLVSSVGPGRLTIPAPPEDAALVDPDVIIVPLAAFDAGGHRLGYGAGYYDRTLAVIRAARRIEALGYAFAVQELPALPAELHDERLDAIATDAGIICPAVE
jgi:5-formyltetrahydrofolate cyclo-ligase